MVNLINRIFCRLGIHSAYFIENVFGDVEEHCHFCPRVVHLYHRRRW